MGSPRERTDEERDAKTRRHSTKLGCEMQPEQEITARDAIRLFTSKRHKNRCVWPDGAEWRCTAKASRYMEGKKLRRVKEERRRNIRKWSLQTSVIFYRPLRAGKAAFNYQLSIFALPGFQTRLLCPRQSAEWRRWTSDVKSRVLGCAYFKHNVVAFSLFSVDPPAEISQNSHFGKYTRSLKYTGCIFGISLLSSRTTFNTWCLLVGQI